MPPLFSIPGRARRGGGLSRRVLYTLRMFWLHRGELAAVHSAQPTCLGVLELSPRALHRQGIRVLALDFDGVLAPHGEIGMNAEIEAWVDECVREFGSERVFIFSNKPMPARLAYFAQRYPGLYCVRDVAKKPYPEGLQQILARSGASPHTLLMVDDRLLTGVLAACISGCRAAYVRRPMHAFRKRPLREVFFMLLRSGERGLLEWAGRKRTRV